MTSPGPVQLLVYHVDAQGRGAYEYNQVGVHYEITSADEGVTRLINRMQTAYFSTDSLPVDVREAVQAFVNAALQALPIPVMDVLGQAVSPSVDLRHCAFRVDAPGEAGPIKMSGVYRYVSGHNENLDYALEAAAIPTDVGLVLEQLKPWARSEARQHMQAELDRALAPGAPVEVFVRKSKVLLSYRHGEADEFTDKLFQRLDKSGLIEPLMDKYHQAPGPWLSNIEALLADAQGMVAVVTETYEKGPITELERNEAIVKAQEQEGFRLVSAWLTAEPTGFLRGFSRADFRPYSSSGDEQDFEPAYAALVALLLAVHPNPDAPQATPPAGGGRMMDESGERMRVESHGQLGGITAGIVHIHEDLGPKIELSDMTHTGLESGAHRYETILTVGTNYAVPEVRIVARANSIQSLDVAPQRGGMHTFGHTGKREGHHFTTIQNAAGKYRIWVTTNEPEEVTLDLE